ncbi:HAMP domain-containing sensor histidine kinase [Haloimpatiens massiliensis]|uniref:HAMP domain-containing sensor histidine kinase n=1 Tax=Haloimpatiens massiliensis TaxID=1658110 RepID=UPI000C83D7BF|nr:sensor histidine kinase [Haloimpatiens massiliensis]
MDTKLKNNKSKFIINAILLCILVLSSLGIYALYPSIKKAADNKHESFSFNDRLFDIRNSNYTIYYDILNKKENKNLKPSEVLLSSTVNTEQNTEEEVKERKNNFDNDIYDYRSNLDYNKNMQYYAFEKQSKLSEGRNEDKIINLLSENLDAKIIQEFNNKYLFYLVIDYNEVGEMKISKIYGADRVSVNQAFSKRKTYVPENLEVKPIKNMTYIYAVPKELKYFDNIYNLKVMNENSAYRQVSFIYINIVVLLIVIFALIVPYNISKEVVGFKTISRVPIEIMTLIFSIVIVFIYENSLLLINETIKNSLIKILQNLQIELSKGSIEALNNLINIVHWVVLLTVVFLIVTYIKYIFKTGIKEYFKNNSIIVKVIRVILRRGKNTVKSLKDIDLKDKNTKKLIKLLFINFIILLVISSIWFFGIPVAIIYSIVLYKLIRKSYNNISSKYSRLHDAIEEIASGNLDVSVEEDLGIFNDLKEEIQSIQKGLKNAVQEEVKSQRIKTELISNVSHDLKTPLTAIITYVDLLKDETLSGDKRKEYLNILDIKSQRLKDLIEDLFEVSKANSGNINLNIVDVDVVALMKQTLIEVDDKLSKSLLKVRTNYPDGKVILPLDSQRMYRVFENLLNNISKYAMHGSRVYIDIIPDEDKVKIVLKNMAADEIRFNPDEILERFVRGDKSRNTEGSGLGLAIAKSFVEIQGGYLEIQVDGDLFKVIIEFKKN